MWLSLIVPVLGSFSDHAKRCACRLHDFSPLNRSYQFTQIPATDKLRVLLKNLRKTIKVLQFILLKKRWPQLIIGMINVVKPLTVEFSRNTHKRHFLLIGKLMVQAGKCAKDTDYRCAINDGVDHSEWKSR